MPNIPSNRVPGPPLELHVHPEAKPIAVHKLIPVPLCWQQEVNASIDRDVKLGVSQWENLLPGSIEWLRLGKKQQATAIQSLFHQTTLVTSGTKKTITDAWNEYLVRQSKTKIATTLSFITPWCRYLSTGLRGVTGRVNQKIRRDYQEFSKQNQMHR